MLKSTTVLFYSTQRAVDPWYNEVVDLPADANINNFGDATYPKDKVIGHYTQARRSTFEFGLRGHT